MFAKIILLFCSSTWKKVSIFVQPFYPFVQPDLFNFCFFILFVNCFAIFFLPCGFPPQSCELTPTPNILHQVKSTSQSAPVGQNPPRIPPPSAPGGLLFSEPMCLFSNLCVAMGRHVQVPIRAGGRAGGRGHVCGW